MKMKKWWYSESWAKRWVSLLGFSFLLYFLLWSLARVVYEYWHYSWYELAWDVVYCAIFTTSAMLVDWLVGRVAKSPYGLSGWKIGLTLALNFLMLLVLDWVAYSEPDVEDFSLDVIDIYIICIVSTLLALLNIQHGYHQALARLEREQVKIRLNLLQQQLSPHFVFNALSTLQGMVRSGDDEQAEEYMHTLSDIMRYITENIGKEHVALRAALDQAHAYARMLDCRFPGHFRFVFSDELEACEGYVLPVSLQIVIENATSHNVHSKEHPLQVCLELEDGCVKVANERRPTEGAQGLGVGLNNLNERYRLSTHRQLRIAESDEWFAVYVPVIGAGKK